MEWNTCPQAPLIIDIMGGDEPGPPATRLAIYDILSKYLDPYTLRRSVGGSLRAKIHSEYGLAEVDKRQLHASLCRDSDVALKRQDRFLYLEPTEKHQMVPLVTLQSSNGWANFGIYTLLMMLDTCSTLQVLAIRFETDEGSCRGEKRGSHDFCHAQLCTSISPRAKATTPAWLPESQPSIPLDAEEPIGLVLCMLTSLYGARHVVNRLKRRHDTKRRGARNLDGHLEKLRALKSRPTNGES